MVVRISHFGSFNPLSLVAGYVWNEGRVKVIEEHYIADDDSKVNRNVRIPCITIITLA